MSKRMLGAMSMGAVALILTVLFITGGRPADRESATVDPPTNGVAATADPAADNRGPWSAVAWRQLVGAVPLGPEAGHDRFDGLTASAGRLVAWGRASTPGRNQFNDMGAIFVSDTGERWQTVLLTAGVAPPDGSEIQHVAAGRDGFVAFGGVCCEAEERPALWTSLDGLEWKRVPYPETMFGSNIVKVVGTPDRWIAAGTTADGGAALWTSVNGVDWRPVDDATADLGPGGINDVVATEDGLIATGWLDTGETYDGAMWQSLDGLTWTPTELDPVFSGDLDTVIVRVIPFAGGWWAYGVEGPHEDRVACERALGRVASIDGVPAPPKDPPTFSCGWGVDTFWVSDDGAAWERLPVRGLGVPAPRGELIEFRFVAIGGPGLVAMGEGSGDSHPSPFANKDGRRWTRLPSQPSFTIGQSLSGFAVVGRRLVVVGEDWNPNLARPPIPAIWIGEVR